jgi:D-glycero-D-manno-heptose 1,7-bisphosphate phosphatase
MTTWHVGETRKSDEGGLDETICTHDRYDVWGSCANVWPCAAVAGLLICGETRHSQRKNNAMIQVVTHPLPYKLLIFDADGTLRGCTTPGQPCPNTPDEWALLPNVKETLAQYDGPHNERYTAIVSNQGGIALGFLSWWDAKALLDACGRQAFPDRRLPRVYFCPHAPKAGCHCRKPSPYLLLQAVVDRNVRLWDTLYVGDHDSDRDAAERADIAFLSAADFFGWGMPRAIEAPAALNR